MASPESYISHPISSLPTPSAILDASLLRRNCTRLLTTVHSLNLSFRPHIKTHKTLEVTKLQLGPNGGQKRVIVSTVKEAEYLEPLVKEGWVEDILYGLPCPPSSLPRLKALLERNANLTIALLIDHPAQLAALPPTPRPWELYVKVDSGYHRAGISTVSSSWSAILTALQYLDPSIAVFRGLYSHAGHSYASTSTADAAGYLLQELETVENALSVVPTELKKPGLRVSIGATPTALATAAGDGKVEDAIRSLKSDNIEIEIHAGVYAVLDLQQLAMHSDPSITHADLALTILAEVISLYPERGEALIALGTLGIGREPGKIEGWGVVVGRDGGESGWRLGRISQEHGILVKDGEGMELTVGMKVRVWPQHACVAGAMYEEYFVVDGERDREEEKGEAMVREVWGRWRGW